MRADLRATTRLVALLLAGVAGAAFAAESPSFMAATAAIACEQEEGTAAKVCRDYCGGDMACFQADDGDDDTEPVASRADCQRARERFRSLTGRDVPCRQLIACPCSDPANWADMRDGMIWQNFALGSFDAWLSGCGENSSQTRLWQNGLDDATTGAGIDTALAECEVIDTDRLRAPRTLRVGSSAAKICRRLLRDVAGDLCD